MTDPQFSDHTKATRSLLPASVAAQLRAELPNLLSRTSSPSSVVLQRMMRRWAQVQAPLFIQMIHEIAYAAGRKSLRFYGPPITSWSGDELVVRSTQRPFDQLPIGESEAAVCSWEGFISSLLTGEDITWFRQALETHDRLVGASH